VKELEKQVEIGMQGPQVKDYSAEVDSLKVRSVCLHYSCGYILNYIPVSL